MSRNFLRASVTLALGLGLASAGAYRVPKPDANVEAAVTAPAPWRPCGLPHRHRGSPTSSRK